MFDVTEAHAVMTPEEYGNLPIKGWHSVHRDWDGFGNTAVRFGARGQSRHADDGPSQGGDRLCCCIPDQNRLDRRCQNDAEWTIEHGPTPDDYTESCTEHVGTMLTDAVEHRIYRIACDGDD